MEVEINISGTLSEQKCKWSPYSEILKKKLYNKINWLKEK